MHMTEQHWPLQRNSIGWQKVDAARLPRLNLAGHSPQVAVVLLAAVAVVTTGIMDWLVPAHPTLPLVSLTGLAVAMAALLLALTFGTKRRQRGLTLWDTAGVFALVGFGAGMLSDPESIVQLFFGEQPQD
jgi:hypothetical protein